MNFQEWAEQFSEMLATDTIRLIDGNAKPHGDEALRYMESKYLEKYVALMLYKQLRTRPVLGTSKKAREEFLVKKIGEMKLHIQEAVALGFQQAMTAFSGQAMDYYCQIKLVPDTISDKVN